MQDSLQNKNESLGGINPEALEWPILDLQAPVAHSPTFPEDRPSEGISGVSSPENRPPELPELPEFPTLDWDLPSPLESQQNKGELQTLPNFPTLESEKSTPPKLSYPDFPDLEGPVEPGTKGLQVNPQGPPSFPTLDLGDTKELPELPNLESGFNRETPTQSEVPSTDYQTPDLGDMNSQVSKTPSPNSLESLGEESPYQESLGAFPQRVEAPEEESVAGLLKELISTVKKLQAPEPYGGPKAPYDPVRTYQTGTWSPPPELLNSLSPASPSIR